MWCDTFSCLQSFLLTYVLPLTCFSLHKFICTKLQKEINTDKLSHCMRNCKFRSLINDSYVEILKKMVKSRRREIEETHRVVCNTYHFLK